MSATFADALIVILIASLRIGLVFAFAPPFTYFRPPALFRVFLALGLAACLVDVASSGGAPPRDAGGLLNALWVECLVGLIFVVTLQVSYAGLEMAGRTLDLQAGQGFGGFVDPASRSPTPPSSLLLTRAAGVCFFVFGDHWRLTALMARSFEAAPVGRALPLPDPMALGAFATTMLGLGLAIAGASLFVLFIADLAIAMLVRTAPQINALILGAQVKSALLLLSLPLAFAGGGAMFERFNAVALEGLAGLIGG